MLARDRSVARDRARSIRSGVSYAGGHGDTKRPKRRQRLERELEALHDASVAWAIACSGLDRVEAEDVLQTAYIEVLEGRARFEGRASFKTFLFGVIRRVAASRRRRRFVRALLLARFSPAPAASDLEQETAAAQRSAQVRKALASLARRQREVLELVFFHEMPVDEAAGVMGVSRGSARVHYHRGKARLAALLDGPAPLGLAEPEKSR